MTNPLVAFAERRLSGRVVAVRFTRWVLERAAIPVRCGTKVPAIAGWPAYTDRRPTPEERARWARDFPCPPWNRAVVLGPSSGVVALDIESAAGHGQNGWRMLEGREVPATLAVLTGSGGHHLYYLRPPRGIRSFPRLLPGVELRADGLPMLLPPSRVGDRPPYEWSADAPVALLPQWLIDTESWAVWGARERPRPFRAIPSLSPRPQAVLHEHVERILRVCRCAHPRCGCQRARAGDLVHCQAHDDREPSLHLDVRDGRVLVHCFSGCPQDAVLASLAELGAWP